jgi:crotonobetainyl-CoA:carnitine CoA-transferase CaiB-like acyl-CoA transferase
MSGPLAGTRVLEIADGIAGPYCGLLLADLGAEVVKLEPPEGDRSRGWRADGLTYRLLNRGKRGATVPLADDRSAGLVARLAADCDAVVIDTDALAAWPHLAALLDDPAQVVCRISLFGAEGPMAGMPVAELPAQLLSEATASVGAPGIPGRAGVDIGSSYAGIYSAQAILAALLVSDPGTGAGEVIDVSLVGSLMAMRSTLWVALSNPDEWWGFHLESYDRPPFRGYICTDGRIYFDLRHAASVDWDALLAELGIADIRDDPRFPDLMVLGAGPGARYADAAEPVWNRAFRERSVEQVTEIINRYGGDVFRVNDYPELLATDQVTAVGNVAPATDEVPAHIRAPWDFSLGPSAADEVPAPELGTSARALLAAGGASEGALARWTAAALL